MDYNNLSIGTSAAQKESNVNPSQMKRFFVGKWEIYSQKWNRLPTVFQNYSGLPTKTSPGEFSHIKESKNKGKSFYVS